METTNNKEIENTDNIPSDVEDVNNNFDVENAEDDSENNLEKTLEKEEFLLRPTVVRATSEEILNAVKSSLCTCNDCHARFIKRKLKVYCPVCHSTDIKDF